MASGINMRNRQKPWRYHTGVLVNMTSNTTPVGFTADTWQWPTGGYAWQAFDSNLSGTAVTCSYDTWAHDFGVELYFPRPIKIQEYWRSYGANQQTNWKGLLMGLNMDNIWVELDRYDTQSVTTRTFVTPTAPMKAIRFVTYARPDLHVWINSVRITKWWDRG